MRGITGGSYTLNITNPNRAYLYFDPTLEIVSILREGQDAPYEFDPRHCIRWEIPRMTTTAQVKALFASPEFRPICEELCDNDLNERGFERLMRRFLATIQKYIPGFDWKNTAELLGNTAA